MSVRPWWIVVAVLLFANAAFAEVVIIGSKSLTITVNGQSGSGTIFFTGDEKPTTMVVGLGPLGESEVRLGLPVPGKAGHSVQVTVTPKANQLAPGASHTGTVVFVGTDKKVTEVPITVTRPAATFAVEALQADMCLDCGDPRVIPLRIRNTGTTTIDSITVLPIALRDGSRHHEWLIPPELPGGESAGSTRGRRSLATAVPVILPTTTGTTQAGKPPEPPTQEPTATAPTGTTATDTTTNVTATTDTTATVPTTTDTMTTNPEPPVSVPRNVEVGSPVVIGLLPGQAQVIHVPFAPPRYAGDYGGSIEVATAGGEPVKAAITLRSRGPFGGSALPIVLFVLIIVLGAWLAWQFEDYFGTGGGQTRNRAKAKLHDARDEIVEVGKEVDAWQADDAKLPIKLATIAAQIDDLRRTIARANRASTADLEAKAAAYAVVLEKWRVFQFAMKFAEDRKAEVAANLDRVKFDQELAALKTAVEDAVKPAANRESLQAAVPSAPEAEIETSADLEIEDARFRQLRRGVLLAISLATAYLALYHGKCSYGSLPDYITAFFWSVGLTQAGNAVIIQGRTNYAPAP